MNVINTIIVTVVAGVFTVLGVWIGNRYSWLAKREELKFEKDKLTRQFLGEAVSPIKRYLNEALAHGQFALEILDAVKPQSPEIEGESQLFNALWGLQRNVHDLQGLLEKHSGLLRCEHIDAFFQEAALFQREIAEVEALQWPEVIGEGERSTITIEEAMKVKEGTRKIVDSAKRIAEWFADKDSTPSGWN